MNQRREPSEIMKRGGWSPETAKQVANGDMCHAAKDGDCIWPLCPQNRDNEPHTNGRHCPLDTWDAYE